jgi:hypothetical protein
MHIFHISFKVFDMFYTRGYADSIYSLRSLVLTGAWAGLGVFDSMIFTLTFYRALSQRRANRLQLITVLLRDGMPVGCIIFQDEC